LVKPVKVIPVFVGQGHWQFVLIEIEGGPAQRLSLDPKTVKK
jgi:hypothetical protein